MKQTMHNTRVRWVLGILIALTLAFIWSNSMQSRAVSGGMSGSFKKRGSSSFCTQKSAKFFAAQGGAFFRNTAFWVWKFFASARLTAR